MDTTSLQEIESAIGPKTKIVWLESPTNPRQMISDIKVSHKKAIYNSFSNIIGININQIIEQGT